VTASVLIVLGILLGCKCRLWRTCDWMAVCLQGVAIPLSTSMFSLL